MHATLSKVFVDVFGKRLAATECRAENVSKTQAIQTGGAQDMLGRPAERQVFGVDYHYLTDSSEDSLTEASTATLTDTRRNDPSRLAEWRLNYPKSAKVMYEAARAGDLIWIARLAEDPERLIVVVSPALSETAARLDRIMGTGLVRVGLFAPQVREDFVDGDLGGGGVEGLDAEDAELLTTLGIDVETPSGDLLERLLADVAELPVSPKSGLVDVRSFSACVRSYLPHSDPVADPDAALTEWMAITTELFFLYEHHVSQARVDQALANRPTIDMHDFLELAKSILNARKSRAGGAFEQHWLAIMAANGVRLSHTANTRDRSKPDFLMPSVAAYDDSTFPRGLITFLGAKTTSRERWRQQVGEAADIPVKHFTTMDTQITDSSLDTMATSGVVPVIPRPVVEQSYATRGEIMTIASFLGLVLERQARSVDLGLLSGALDS